MTHRGRIVEKSMAPSPDRPAASAAPGMSRRRFLKTTAAACGALAAPMLIPASALGRNGAVAPSERIVMGAIGVGRRGTFDLNAFLHERDAQVVAVCDVQRVKRDAAKALVDEFYGNKDCLTYRDFRELVARPDIDAVTFVTSDRWHAPGAMTVMAAGKDVYCEKPGSLAIDESQRLVRTARRYGRIFQSGIQRLSEANFIIAGELVRTGRLGKVHTVYAHLYNIPVWPRKKNVSLPAQPEPDREEVDWDLWLGACAWRPFNVEYIKPGGWRIATDLSTGIAEWGSHTIAQCQVDLGQADTSPVAYEYPETGDAEGFTAHFANGLKLVLTRNGWHGTCGIRYEGDEGWVSVADGYERPEVSSPRLLEGSRKLVDDHIARTGHPLGHHRDFLDGVRARRRGMAHEEIAHRTMSTNHIMDICMELKRNLKWDPAKEEFVGDDEANRMRIRHMRPPYQI